MAQGQHHAKVIIIAILALGLIVGLVSALNIDLTRRDSPDETFSASLLGRTITEDGINADFFCEAGDAPRKVVIILGGSEGGKHWSTNTRHIQALLDEGYCVMVLAYFNAPGLPDYLRAIPLEYFERAFNWLAIQPEIVPNDYAVFGGSRGGELALELASHYSQIKTVIALDPSSVRVPSPPTTPLDTLLGQHASWTYRGNDLPYLPMPRSLDSLIGLLSGNEISMFEEALKSTNAADSATIAVENIQGPVLCLADEMDSTWPSTHFCAQIIARLADHGFLHHYEQVSYPWAHNTCTLDGCWAKTTEFLAEYFK